MSKQEIERLDDQGMAAWESGDADAWVSLLADDFVWYDWTQPEPIRDKDTARKYFSSWRKAFPDMSSKQTARVLGEDSVAAEIEWTGTNSGPMEMGGNVIPPTNKTVVGRGSYMAFVRGGKVVEFRSHPDAAGIMMQLGLVPAM
jgi:ketosteroid isomerase-like protein